MTMVEVPVGRRESQRVQELKKARSAQLQEQAEKIKKEKANAGEDLDILDSSEDLHPMRISLILFFRNHYTDGAVTFIVLFNMVVMVLETDAGADGDDPPFWLVVANSFLLVLYTVELVLKLWAFQSHFFRDNWNMVDFGVVAVDLGLLFLSVVWENLPQVSMLRAARLARLAKAVKVAKNFKELHKLIRGYMGAIRAIFWGMLMITMILLFWGILAVQILHPIAVGIDSDSCPACSDAHRTVFRSMLTFFQQVVAGDSWGAVSVPMIQHSNWTWLFFVAVIITVNLTMLNLILAVIVEAAAQVKEEDLMEVADQQAEKMAKSKLRLLELCEMMDQDQNEHLNEEELLYGFDEIPEFRQILLSMEIEKHDVHLVFNALDEDSSGEINYFEFVEQLQRVKSQTNQLILFYVSDVRHKLRYLEDSLGIVAPTNSTRSMPFSRKVTPDQPQLKRADSCSTKDGSVSPRHLRTLGIERAMSRNISEVDAPTSGSKSSTEQNQMFETTKMPDPNPILEQLERLAKASEQLATMQKDMFAHSQSQTTLLSKISEDFSVAVGGGSSRDPPERWRTDEEVSCSEVSPSAPPTPFKHLRPPDREDKFVSKRPPGGGGIAMRMCCMSDSRRSPDVEPGRIVDSYRAV